MVDEELKRAILSESAEALKYWFGVGTKAVWAWRRAFGVPQFGTPGSSRLHRAASEKGAGRTRVKRLPAEQVERRRRTAVEKSLSRFIQPCPSPNGSRPWAPEELAMLGKVPDDELARRTGRSANGLSVKRNRLRIPSCSHGRRT